MESNNHYRYLCQSENPTKDTIHLLHFNDVYNLTPHISNDPISKGRVLGGASKFGTLIKRYNSLNPIITFGGDWVAPSFLSSFTKGMHMWEVLEAMNVHFGTHGNHDFDYGVEYLNQLTNCDGENGKKPGKICWIMSNMLSTTTGKPLAGCQEYVIVNWNGVCIGIIGVSENWLSEAGITEKDAIYIPFIEAGEKLASTLKKEHNVDLVIALSHNWNFMDRNLSKGAPSIDLILGGHVHDYTSEIEENRLVKSGCDFEFLTVVKIEVSRDSENRKKKFFISSERVDCTEDIPDDIEINNIIIKYTNLIEEKKKEVIGISLHPINALRCDIRVQENGFANLIADLMRNTMDTDVAWITSGSISSDKYYTEGNILLGTIMSLFPWGGTIVSIKVKGSDLVKSCERSVEAWPLEFGFFAHVSGMSFEFCSNKPPLSRIVNVKIGGEPVIADKYYSLATTEFISNGGDGYSWFVQSQRLVDGENGKQIIDTILNYIKLNSPIQLKNEGRIKLII